jgi:CTP synthase (UTP-ammonia lyase)
MPVTIAVLGDRNVDFLTHREIDATLALVPADVDARWLPSPEAESAAEADGLWVVPGTPYRDDGAVLEAIHRARTAGMPILGTCGGFQYMVVEFARNAAGIGGAAYEETDPEAPDPVVARLSSARSGR